MLPDPELQPQNPRIISQSLPLDGAKRQLSLLSDAKISGFKVIFFHQEAD